MVVGIFFLVLISLFVVASYAFCSPGGEESAPAPAEIRSQTTSDSIEAQILRAIPYGEILRIRYHGGSQPGSIREIVPKSLKKGLVKAVCVTSNAFKSFRLEKMEIVPIDDSAQVSYDSSQSTRRAS